MVTYLQQMADLSQLIFLKFFLSQLILYYCKEIARNWLTDHIQSQPVLLLFHLHRDTLR